MPVEVVAYQEAWPAQFSRVAEQLRQALTAIASARVEHVGSTAVPGLVAHPILDIDVIVEPEAMLDAVAALKSIGYEHRGHLGLVGREAFYAPDNDPRRNVYVCEASSLNVRNHLAVRDVLRQREDLPEPLRRDQERTRRGSRHRDQRLHRGQDRHSAVGPSRVAASQPSRATTGGVAQSGFARRSAALGPGVGKPSAHAAMSARILSFGDPH